MRLLHVESHKLHEYYSDVPPYAILSHTWGDEEFTFAALDQTQLAKILTGWKKLAGWKKIQYACDQARKDGLEFVWVDTCCIDKSSSAELSEAINSMFRWYANARVCYAYLSDCSISTMAESFPNSRWFRRGWTLQELLAPKAVQFFDKEWSQLGSKANKLTSLISATTQISEDVIRNPDLIFRRSVACRMSWSSNRITTRPEDIAYSLLGIFDVNMPLLYGEGDRAFRRLQEEILKVTDDPSLFAWGLDSSLIDLRVTPQPWIEDNRLHPMAASPKSFQNCGNLVACQSRQYGDAKLSSRGLQIRLPIIEYGSTTYGLLNCYPLGKPSHFVAIQLAPESEKYIRVKSRSGQSAFYVSLDVVLKTTSKEILILAEDHRYTHLYDRLFVQMEKVQLVLSESAQSLFSGPYSVLPEQACWKSEDSSFILPLLGDAYAILIFELQEKVDTHYTHFAIRIRQHNWEIHGCILHDDVDHQLDELPEFDSNEEKLLAGEGASFWLYPTSQNLRIRIEYVAIYGVGFYRLFVDVEGREVDDEDEHSDTDGGKGDDGDEDMDKDTWK